MSRTSNAILSFTLLFLLGIMAQDVWARDHQQCCKKHAAVKDDRDCRMKQLRGQSSGCDEKGTKENSSPCPSDMFFKKMCAILSHEEELSLSEEQMSSLKSLKLKTQKDLILKKAEMQVNDLDITTQMWEKKWDADSLNSLIDKKFDLSKEETKILIGSMIALQTTLTQEQTRVLMELYVEYENSKGHCPIAAIKAPVASEKRIDSGGEMKKDTILESPGTMDIPIPLPVHPSESITSVVPMNENKEDMIEMDQNMENLNSTTY